MTVKNIGSSGVEFPDSTVQGSAAYTKAESDGSAFSASRSGSQALPDVTETPILFNTIGLDTDNAFNVSNGRYTAKVAGWYQVNWALSVTGIPVNTNYGVTAFLSKNGSTVCVGINNKPASNLFANPGGSALVYMNGTTDYIQISAYPDSGSGSASIVGDSVWRNQFSGFLARKA